MRTSANRTRPIVVGLVAAIAALALAVSPTLAAVSFDASTATGHVDRSDVQAAFGWRDQAFQANARKVGFHLETVGSLSWDCVVGGQVVTLLADVADSRSIDSAAIATGGRHGSVSGFDLYGFATAASSTASCSSGAPANVVWSGSHVLYADFRTRSGAVWSD